MTRRRLRPELVSMVFQQLADGLRDGLPLRGTLAILERDTDLPKYHAEFLGDLAAAVRETRVLSSALELHANTFPPEAVAFVRECERRDQLTEALALLARDYELLATQRVNVKEALQWPIAVLTVLAFISATLLIFVIPAFKQVFASFGADLPGLTLLVVAISDLVVDYWYWGVILIVALAVLARRRRGFALLDELATRIPFVRRFLITRFISRLSQILEQALAGKVPLIQAITYFRAATGNSRLTRIVGALEAQLLEGKDILNAARDTPDMPGALVTALELGNEIQSPASVLRRITAFSEGDAERSIEQFNRAMQVLTYCLTGLIVGFFVIAMYLPIFKLGQAV